MRRCTYGQVACAVAFDTERFIVVCAEPGLDEVAVDKVAERDGERHEGHFVGCCGTARVWCYARLSEGETARCCPTRRTDRGRGGVGGGPSGDVDDALLRDVQGSVILLVLLPTFRLHTEVCAGGMGKERERDGVRATGEEELFAGEGDWISGWGEHDTVECSHVENA